MKVILIDPVVKSIEYKEIPQSYEAIEKLICVEHNQWECVAVQGTIWNSDALFAGEMFDASTVADFTVGDIAVKGRAVIAQVGRYTIPDDPELTIEQLREGLVWAK